MSVPSAPPWLPVMPLESATADLGAAVGHLELIVAAGHCIRITGEVPMPTLEACLRRLLPGGRSRAASASGWPPALAEAKQAWQKQLPADAERLFAALQALSQGDLLSLPAVCVASCVDAVNPLEADTKANTLASALSLDMAQWWTATAAGYFAHVSKAQVLEAVQCVTPDQVRALGLSKKPELVAAAERLAKGSGWLPAMLQS